VLPGAPPCRHLTDAKPGTVQDAAVEEVEGEEQEEGGDRPSARRVSPPSRAAPRGVSSRVSRDTCCAAAFRVAVRTVRAPSRPVRAAAPGYGCVACAVPGWPGEVRAGQAR